MYMRLSNLLIVVTALLSACGGGAVLNQSANKLQESTEFCGVNIRFSDQPKAIPKRETDEFLVSLGNGLKNNITGLYNENHQMTEVALCLCTDIAESMGISSRITPPRDARNYKKEIIEKVGSSESWDNDESSRKIYRKVTNISARSSCQLMQNVITPLGTSNYPAFLDSISEIRARNDAQNKSSPKDRLLQLDALRKDGLITQLEYETKKKTILDSF